MTDPIVYWSGLYQKFKYQSLCLDIECVEWNGAISVVGLYKPKEGEIESVSLVRGRDLSRERLIEEFKGCKLFITYNGLSFDVPHLKKEFPGVVPDVPVFDVYRFARLLGVDTNLLVLENTLDVFRKESVEGRKRIAVKLWKKWEKYKDIKALEMLIEYNRQDTVNLFPLAEKLVKMVKSDS